MWQLKWLLAARRPDSELLLAAAECHRAVNDPHGILPTIADALKRSPTSLQLLLTAAKLRCQVKRCTPALFSFCHLHCTPALDARDPSSLELPSCVQQLHLVAGPQVTCFFWKQPASKASRHVCDGCLKQGWPFDFWQLLESYKIYKDVLRP